MRTSAAAWLILLAGCGGCERSADPGGGSVSPHALVLITVDGLIADELSVFGGPLATPHLKALADAGMAWRDAWTSTPLTRPAVATYLTGVLPDRHGLRDDLLSALSDTIPTLATVLEERGYVTAAFPDSSFLCADSGLHRGFGVVDDPPQVIGMPLTWLPYVKPKRVVAADFKAWVESLPAGSRYFAWLHISRPLLAQMLGGAAAPAAEGAEDQTLPAAVAAVDEALGTVLSAIEAHGDLDRAAVAVAGTFGDVRGDEASLPGPGFSLEERALRVPVIVRLPGGERREPTAGPRWAPDVAVFLARQGGATLPGAEGTDLLEPAPPERILLAWSWATRDQMGWRALAAARAGTIVRIEGREDEADRVLSAEEQRLAAALDAHAEPAAPAVPPEATRALLEARSIRTEPVPPEGRKLEPAALRLSVAREVWQARRFARAGDGAGGMASYDRVLEQDPDNLAALLGAGQVAVLSGGEVRGRALLERAVRRYPDNPEVLHWYAHALWSQSWSEAAKLLELILPFKPQDADLLYDLACARSLSDDVPGAERYLRAAIEAGYRQWDHMETDADLRNLRKSGRFAAMAQEYR